VAKELCKMDAISCAQAIASRETSPAELASTCLARIDMREEATGAWQFLDPEIIESQLRKLDSIAKDARGPLHGLPVGVKDIYDTCDMPTAYGSDIYSGNRPPWDAAAVARLRAAGAVVLGKTVTTEFAYWKAGKTRNPHDTSRTPGGSSSGSAAGVADFMMPLAIGSQTVASTMRPASFCGIIGFKPSYGRISMAGIKPLAGSLDTAGVFARTVSDAALIASVMAGRNDWGSDGNTGSAPSLRIARTPDWDHVLPEAVSSVEKAAHMLLDEGATLEDHATPEIFDDLSNAQNTVLAFEAAREFSSEWLYHRQQLSPQIAGLIEEGLALTPEQYEDAVKARDAARCAIDELFGSADFLLAPSTIGEAPPADQGTGDPLMSRAWTLLGLPTFTVPCGNGPAGLPLGLQIAARPGMDHKLIAAAQWIEPRLS